MALASQSQELARIRAQLESIGSLLGGCGQGWLVQGAPGIPNPPGIPVVEGDAPLTKLLSNGNSRGRQVDVPLPPLDAMPDAEGRIISASVPIFDTMSVIGCVVGTELAIRLGDLVPVLPNGVHIEDCLTTAPVVVQVRAILRFGLGSAPFDMVECDWLHGTELALSADIVGVQAKIIVQTDPGFAADDLVLPTAFNTTAGVGYGSTSRNSNGARLTEIRFLEAQQTKLVRIPSQAISATVVPFGDSASVEMRYRAFGSPYSATYTKNSPMLNYQGENSLPQFGGAEFVELVNTDSEASVRCAVVFGLAL